MSNLRNKPLWLLLISIVLFCILYFVLDTKPNEQRLLEKSRSLNFESTNIQVLRKEAKENLSEDVSQFLDAMELQFHQEQDTIRKDSLREILSSRWFKAGHASIAGYYAEEIASTANTAESWGITGTTFFYGITNPASEKAKSFCKSRAIKAFENAISLEPENVDYRINKALVEVEMPPEQNPMSGILQLVQLTRDFPGETKVLNQLGRLSLKTNQLDNALDRLTQAYQIDSTNKTTICLLAEVYEKKNETSLAQEFVSRCTELINKK